MQRPWDAILWWELRRIPFNAALALAGVITVGLLEVLGAPLVPPGEDLIEPVFLFLMVGVYAVLANLGFTLGWVTELLWSGGETTRTEPMRNRIFWLGL